MIAELLALKVLKWQARTIRGGQKPARNSPCYCGSNNKYKYCHGAIAVGLIPRKPQ